MSSSSIKSSLLNEFFETDAKEVVQCLSILLPKLFVENKVDIKSMTPIFADNVGNNDL